MNSDSTDGRKRFVVETFPHLDSLWQNALWLTMHNRHAEDLVLKTVTKGYREWHDYGDTVSCKVWLFRILMREYFGYGIQGSSMGQSRTLPSYLKSMACSDRSSPSSSISAIEHSHLLQLSSISEVSLKRAIARLRPWYRMVILLWLRDRLSYADIAYVTDCTRSSVRTILARFRALISRQVLENVASGMENAGGLSAVQENSADSDCDYENACLRLLFTRSKHILSSSALDCWENEGGSLEVQFPGLRLCQN